MAKKAKAAPVVEDEEDLELEELDEDAEEETPKKSGVARKDDDVVFGASDLAKLASKVAGKEYTAKTIRVLLRKMAKDGRIDRVISPGNRNRYSWSGPDDPEVKKVLKAVKGGEIEAARNEALQKLKDQKAAKDAKAGKGKKTATAKKKAAPPVDEDEDLDDVDDLDDDDE